jgi:hypothetical protein
MKPVMRSQGEKSIYNIPCEWSTRYIGETGRPLDGHLSEHNYNIKGTVKNTYLPKTPMKIQARIV